MNEEQLKIVLTAVNKTKPVFAKMKSDLKVLSTKMKAVGQTATRLGRTLSTRLGLPMLAVAGAGIKAFSDLDKALTESTAIMGNVTDETRAKMKGLAEDMSTKVPFAANQLADAFFFLASAGLNAEQSMAALPAVAEFATAGAFDLSRATDLLTDAQSALGLTVDDSGENMENMVKISDILVKANTLANASVSQFSEALTNEAGVAMRQYGIEVENGVAVLAALADQGIKGNIAGSLLSRSIRLLTKASLENREEFEAMGIAVFDAEGNFRDFADIAGDMEKAFDGMSTKQRSVALETLGFAARTQQAILPLIGMSEQIREYDKNLSDAGGTTADVSNKQLKSFSNQMKTTFNSLKVLVGGIAEQMAPALEKLAGWVKKVSIRFNNLSPTTKKIIGTVGLLLIALGPVLIIFGQLAIAIGALIPVVAGLGTAFVALTTGPIGLVIAGLALLVVGIKAGIDGFREIRGVSEKELEAIGQSVDELVISNANAIRSTLVAEERIASEIQVVYAELLEARKSGMLEVVEAKKVELETLLSLEKQGALDRLSVLQAEGESDIAKRDELVKKAFELSSKIENPFLFFRKGEFQKQKDAILKEIKIISDKKNKIIEASDRIREVSSGLQGTTKDIFAEDTITTITEKNVELQDVQDETAEATETMAKDVDKAYSNMEDRVDNSIDVIIKKNQQLMAELAKFRSLTVPTEGPDRRTDAQVATQAGVPDPAAGGIFTPQDPDFNPQYPGRSPSRIQDNVRDKGGGSTLTVNLNNPVIDTPEREKTLVDRLKLVLGRDFAKSNLSSS